MIIPGEIDEGFPGTEPSNWEKYESLSKGGPTVVNPSTLNQLPQDESLPSNEARGEKRRLDKGGREGKFIEGLEKKIFSEQLSNKK